MNILLFRLLLAHLHILAIIITCLDAFSQMLLRTGIERCPRYCLRLTVKTASTTYLYFQRMHGRQWRNDNTVYRKGHKTTNENKEVGSCY